MLSFRKQLCVMCVCWTTACEFVLLWTKLVSVPVCLLLWHKGAWVGVCECVLQRQRQSVQINWKCFIAKCFVIPEWSTDDCILKIILHLTSGENAKKNKTNNNTLHDGKELVWPVKAAALSPFYCSAFRKGQQNFFWESRALLLHQGEAEERL